MLFSEQDNTLQEENSKVMWIVKEQWDIIKYVATREIALR